MGWGCRYAATRETARTWNECFAIGMGEIRGLRFVVHATHRMCGAQDANQPGIKPMKQARVRSNSLHKGISRALHTGVLAVALSLSMPVGAQSATVVRFDIPAQRLSTALQAYASQAGMQLLYQPKALGSAMAQPVQGELGKREALQRLLEGSGLEVVYSSENAATIRRAASPPATGQKKSEPAKATHSSGDGAPSGGAATAPYAAKVSTLDTMVVTGTRIRGGTTPSPVITIDSTSIREEGFTDLGEVARNLPQNYSGGQNPGVIPFTISGAGGQNTNITGGSALNLRGLGQDASLTLLNGRRMAYGGVSQGVDISAIPVEAVERIEIVPDGASAIYGSDAVGGVANVLIQRSYDGVSLGARHGGATGGGLTTREYTATGGATWNSGGMIATVKDVSTDPIFARQRRYTEHLRDPWTLYPESDQQSGLLSIHQQVGAVAELRLDAFRTRRSQRYSVYNDVGNQFVSATPETMTWMVSPGIEWFLPNDWTMSVAGAWAHNRHDQHQSTQRLATGAVSVTDTCVCTDSRVVELGAEGPLFALPGGDARLAVGAGHRRNGFLEYNHVTDKAMIEGSEASRFAYVELNLPLLGPDQHKAGARRLELSAAMRGEDHDSFGRVTTPKLGLIYGPNADFTLKTSWGKSFKAPTLYQLLRSEQVVLRLARASGGTGFPSDATVLYLDGGNPELEPERARTWTASLAFHPEVLPGLETELTYFDIDYAGRVVQPITDPTQALSNPAYAEFVRLSPSPSEQAAIIARDGDGIVTNQAGMPYDPGKVVAVIYFQFRNAVQQRIRGIDLSGSYRFDLAHGRLAIRGSASWLDSTQRFATTEFDLSGTLHNPPRLVGRLGAVWTAGPVTASSFLNYKGGLENTIASERTASFTTVDAALRYAPGRNVRALPGWEFALSVQNLLNQAPPLHDISKVTPFLVPPYDATNYSPIGRFVSVALTKHW